MEAVFIAYHSTDIPANNSSIQEELLDDFLSSLLKIGMVVAVCTSSPHWLISWPTFVHCHCGFPSIPEYTSRYKKQLYRHKLTELLWAPSLLEVSARSGRVIGHPLITSNKGTMMTKNFVVLFFSPSSYDNVYAQQCFMSECGISARYYVFTYSSCWHRNT